MPRPAKGPRLYLHGGHLDYPRWIEFQAARAALQTTVLALRKPCAQYLGSKHKPAPDPQPLVADITPEGVRAGACGPTPKMARNTTYNISALAGWMGRQEAVVDITAANCRAYAWRPSPHAAARLRDLEECCGPRSTIGGIKNYNPIIVPSIPIAAEAAAA